MKLEKDGLDRSETKLASTENYICPFLGSFHSLLSVGQRFFFLLSKSFSRQQQHHQHRQRQRQQQRQQQQQQQKDEKGLIYIYFSFATESSFLSIRSVFVVFVRPWETEQVALFIRYLVTFRPLKCESSID